MKIAIAKIVIDESIYPRSRTNEFWINRLVDAIEAGVALPPIVIEARTHRLVDGRHRVEAARAKGLKQIDAQEKTYLTEADLFADAVRLNAAHGQPLSGFDIRNAVARLTALGYHRDQIAEAVKMPLEKIEHIEKGFAHDAAGGAVPLKGGLQHLRGQSVSAEQQAAQRRYGGHQGTFYANQLSLLIENDLWPRSDNFIQAMGKLMALWARAHSESAA